MVCGQESRGEGGGGPRSALVTPLPESVTGGPPPGTLGRWMFTQLGPQAGYGTRPNRPHSQHRGPAHTGPTRPDSVYFSNRLWQSSYFTTVFGNDYYTFTLFQVELLSQFVSFCLQNSNTYSGGLGNSNLKYTTIQTNQGLPVCTKLFKSNSGHRMKQSPGGHTQSKLPLYCQLYEQPL